MRQVSGLELTEGRGALTFQKNVFALTSIYREQPARRHREGAALIYIERG